MSAPYSPSTAFYRWHIFADPGDRSYGNNVQRIATIIGPRIETLTKLLSGLNDGNKYGYARAVEHP